MPSHVSHRSLPVRSSKLKLKIEHKTVVTHTSRKLFDNYLRELMPLLSSGQRWHMNDALQSDCKVLNKFFPEASANPRDLRVLFHGTPSVDDVKTIFEKGFNVKKRNKQKYGAGEYFCDSSSFDIAQSYAGDDGMVIATLAVGSVCKTIEKDKRGRIILVPNDAKGKTTFCLPIAAIGGTDVQLGSNPLGGTCLPKRWYFENNDKEWEEVHGSFAQSLERHARKGTLQFEWTGKKWTYAVSLEPGNWTQTNTSTQVVRRLHAF